MHKQVNYTLSFISQSNIKVNICKWNVQANTRIINRKNQISNHYATLIFHYSTTLVTVPTVSVLVSHNVHIAAFS